MKFECPLIPAVLIRRYKRFLAADVELDTGECLTVHTPNTGAMLGCSTPGSRIWLRDTNNPKRKFHYAWEMTQLQQWGLVGVNTVLANRLVQEAMLAGVVKELCHYTSIQREVPYGKENSRIDLLLKNDKEPHCYVEVKNVTAIIKDGIAIFPDTVSVRGTKHLRELTQMVNQGQRAAIFYCVQRNDVTEVRPADDIDPQYGTTLRQAMSQGVNALAYAAQLSPEGIKLTTKLPVVCP